MDRTRLAERNRRLTEFQHRLAWRERVRRRLLQSYTLLPAPLPQRPIKGTVLLIRPDHLGDILLIHTRDPGAQAGETGSATGRAGRPLVGGGAIGV